MVKKCKPKRSWYTVICLYPDYLTDDFGADIYVDWVLAPDPVQAGLGGQKKAVAAQDRDNPSEIPADDFRVIAVLKGRHTLAADAASY